MSTNSEWGLVVCVFFVFFTHSLSVFLFLSLISLQSHLGNVLLDMKLIDIKDTLPVGFIPIQETVDTRKQSFLHLITLLHLHFALKLQ